MKVICFCKFSLILFKKEKFLIWKKGKKGDRGPRGPRGPRGRRGMKGNKGIYIPRLYDGGVIDLHFA